MPDMYCVISLKKAVADEPEANRLFGIIKQALVSIPDLEIGGHATVNFNLEEPE